MNEKEKRREEINKSGIYYIIKNVDTLESLEIKPMSKYATDRYGRKYPVIDIDNRVDISDIDDEYYDTIDTDDKYNN